MATKKVTAAEIIVKMSDGNTMKILGDKAKQAGKSMKSMAKSTYESDRRLKSLSQQTSGASKAFSKQAQTIQGGIVPIYATIAAQIFAIGAAFRFLQDSFEVRNMIEGQKQFGAVTGIAYQTLTSQLQDATAGMLGFKEAASSLAIGIASGLSGKQVTELGTAAKNASLALGRDLTDSFNRLIRGVTKAEPELLDELGIILRLDNATREYAETVGKTKDQLNAYERTQAVMNNVLTQAEEKYGMIAQVMDPDAFALGQLTKEFDDLVRSFQVGLANTLLPLISFLKDNVLALSAALALFMRPIIGSLLPNLTQVGERTSQTFRDATAAAIEATEAAQLAGAAAKLAHPTTGDPKKLRTHAAKGLKGLGVELKGEGKYGKMLSKQQIAAYRRTMDKKGSIYQKFNIQEKAAFKRHLAEMEQLHATSEGKQVDITTAAEYEKEAARATSEANQAKRAARVAKVQGKLAKGTSALMSGIGYLGIAMMVGQMVWSGIQWFRDLDDDAKKAREETDKLNETLDTLNEEVSRMGRMRGLSMLGGAEAVEQVGNALQSVDIGEQIRAYNVEVKKGLTTKSAKNFKELGDNLRFLSPQMSDLAAEFESGNAITDDAAKHYQRMANAMINASQASKMLDQNTKSLNQQLTKAIGKYGKLPYQDLQQGIMSQLQMYNDMIGMVGGTYENRTAGQNAPADWYGGKDTTSSGLRGNIAARGQQLASIPKGGDLDRLIERSRQTSFDKFVKDREAEGIMGGHHAAWGSSGRQMTATLDSIAATKELARLGKIIGVDAEDWGTSQRDVADALIKGRNQIKEWNIHHDVAVRARTKYKKLEEDIGVYVEKGLENQQTELTNQRNLIKHKIMGVGIEQLQLVNEAKTEAARLKASKKNEEHLAAIANLRQVESGIDNQIVARMKEMSEANEKAGKDAALTTEQLAEIDKLQKDLTGSKNLELKAANASIDLTKQAWDIAKLNTDLTIIQVDSANRLLRLKRSTLDAERDITREKQRQRLEQAERDQLGPGSVAQELLDLIAVRDSLQNVLTAETTKKNDLYAQMQKDFKFKAAETRTHIIGEGTADERTETMTLPGFEGIDFDKPLEYFKDPGDGTEFTQKQKDWNATLKIFEALMNSIGIKGFKVAKMTNDISGENKMLAMEKDLDSMLMFREKIHTLNPMEMAYQEIYLEYLREGKDLDDEKYKALKVRARSVAEQKTNLKIEQELMTGIQSTLENGFVSMFQALADGSKSFKDSMKDLTKSVLADLAAMYLKAAALKFMMAFMPGGGNVMAFLSGGAGGRYGGVYSSSGKSFGYGGIAQGPQSGYSATLHGNEAVVPLGNDRSIPVNLRGAGNNTVNVAVNISGQNSSVSATGGGDAAALGRSIGGLVQQHLQVEMRPGGLLNRQGAKGRGG